MTDLEAPDTGPEGVPRDPCGRSVGRPSASDPICRYPLFIVMLLFSVLQELVTLVCPALVLV
jgi:hypothetical protein